MKKIVILLVLLMTIVLSAAMEEYDRKSISIFKMDVTPAAIMATKPDVQQIYDGIFKKFTGMGRFDYNPIPVGVTNASELFEIVKEYTATKIEERAGKQWDIKNEYYGSNFVTGENVDKIMNGAYILFPRLNAFVVKKKKKGDDFTASISVSVDIYAGKNTGTPENPVWTPELVKTISASGSNLFGSLFDLNLNPKKENKRRKAIKAATNGMLLFLEKELKKVDAFKIKALVTKAEPKKDKIAFNFGKNVGVNVDDAYTVGYFLNKDGKQEYIETGYIKVRKVKDKESFTQLLIVTNPKREKEDDLFNEYDQCYEYPLVGLNFVPNFGLISGFKSWENNPEAGTGVEEIPGAGVAGLRVEYDIAKYLKIPELYLLVGGDLVITDIGDINDGTDTFEYTPATALIEVGIMKKFFIRRFAWYLGASYLHEAMTLTKSDIDSIIEDEEFELNSGGFKAYLGINYLLGKRFFFDMQASYAGMSPLMDVDGNEVLASAADDVQDIFNGIPYDNIDESTFLVPSGLTIKAGFGITF